MLTKDELAKYIDHTLLKPIATFEEIKILCLEAKEYGFYSVCVNSCYVKHIVNILEGSDIKAAVTVGFPWEYDNASKVFEAVEAVKAGAVEIDMVMNVAC